MTTCDHWSECDVPSGGCCSKNLFGGKPSHGVCATCDAREVGGVLQVTISAPQPTPRNLEWVVTGAVKVAKALTHPETEESKARLAICESCDQWTGHACKICGCFVKLKVKIPEEKCPAGKW